MEIKEYRPQSYVWPGFSILLPEELAQAYNSGKTVQCDLMVARDGNTTLVRAAEGTTWFLRSFRISGIVKLLRGEGEFFLASSGSWSGGANLSGAIALKPGALVRFGAKGAWDYLVADADGIRKVAHDPRLFEEEGVARWQPLS